MVKWVSVAGPNKGTVGFGGLGVSVFAGANTGTAVSSSFTFIVPSGSTYEFNVDAGQSVDQTDGGVGLESQSQLTVLFGEYPDSGATTPWKAFSTVDDGTLLIQEKSSLTSMTVTTY